MLDCTALYERFKNYKDPAGVRSLFHHLFLGETVAPVTKDDSSSTGTFIFHFVNFSSQMPFSKESH